MFISISVRIFVRHSLHKNVHNYGCYQSDRIAKRAKKYLDLAEKETVIIKRGKKLIRLTACDKIYENELEEWVKDFLAIPEEYRCNPFDISPSGDVYFADKRNIQALKKSMQQVREGKTHSMLPNETLDEFLDRIGVCIE